MISIMNAMMIGPLSKKAGRGMEVSPYSIKKQPGIQSKLHKILDA